MITKQAEITEICYNNCNSCLAAPGHVPEPSKNLSHRTARLTLGRLESELIHMGSQGTPQGSVLSPFIFNVAIIKLPPLLEAIPGIQHSIYADDITIRATGGSDGDLEERLRQAANTVHA